MKKQLIGLTIALSLLMTIIPNMFFNGTAVSASTAISRAEWIHELVELFDMMVEQNNMPDNYFPDINEQSVYYRDVMVAAEFGIIDIEAGYLFEPESPVTRDFAAHTMNYCLGFQPDEDAVYPFIDVSEILYPDDALIAVNRKWFLLNAGEFLPEQFVTKVEMDAMFADAAIVRSGTIIDGNYNNTYEFENGVIEIPNGIYAIESDNGDITIYDSPKAITAGQIFVVYFDGLPQAYLAKSVSVSGAETTIATDKKDISEVTVEADAQGTVAIDLSLAEAVGDVEIEYEEPEIQPFAEGNKNLGTINIKPYKIPLGNGSNITIKGKISNIYFNYKTRGISYAYAGFSGDYDIDVSANMDFWEAGGNPGYLDLIYIPVAGVGNISVGMEYSVTGSVSLTIGGDFVAGLEYSSGGGFRLDMNFTKKSFTISTELQLTAGIKASAGFNIPSLKANIYARSGVKLGLNTKTYDSGTPHTCIHHTGYMYANIGASATVFKKTFNKTLDIYTSTNSPVRIVQHFEDGDLVPVCTRNKGDFYGNGYSTPRFSRFISGSGGSGQSGNGTASSPYIITNEAELAAIANNGYTNNYKAHYRLANSIVLTTDNWKPIGSNTSSVQFNGVFDGNGYSISTVNITIQGGPAYTGLFGYIGKSGFVKNLGVETAISVTAANVGGIAGYNAGTIQNCYTKGTVISDGTGTKYVGGVVGYNTGVIYDSYSMANVSGNSYVGGLVGNNVSSSLIKRCYATGLITSTSTNRGGLVGNNSSEIMFSYYDKDTTRQGDVGKGFSIPTMEMKIEETFSGWDFANVWTIDSTVNNGYPYLTFKWNNVNPTLSGDGTASNPYIITNERELLGIAGREYTNYNTASYVLANDITLTAKYWQPIGNFNAAFNGIFDGNGYKIVNVNIPQSANEQCNGLFGYIGSNGVVKNLGVDVSISVTSEYAGGIAGQSIGTIQYCYSTGTVISDRNVGKVGGLVGRNGSGDSVSGNRGLIYDCYSTATVSGSNTSTSSYGAGGLVGRNSGGGSNVSIIKRCYATGTVTNTASGGRGGLVGNNSSSSGAILFSYYDKNTTGQSDVGKGFSIPTAEMKNESTFAGWDFTNVWAISSTVNNGYPYLTFKGENVPPVLSGAGTSLNPYIITNERELMGIAGREYTNHNTSSYVLANDITLTAKYWQPIGQQYTLFNGIFDGKGYKISGINIPQSADERNGLFGYIGSNGVVKNLGVDVSISVTSEYAGGIAGQSIGTIQYCYSTGTVVSDGTGTKHVGGLVGYNSSANRIRGIYDSYSLANVSGNSYVGGLVGRNVSANSLIVRCYAAGAVTSTSTYRGGLVGNNSSGEILSSYYDTNTTGQSDTGRGIATATADMKNPKTFAEWNFSEVWTVNLNINAGYPYLIGIMPRPDFIDYSKYFTDGTASNYTIIEDSDDNGYIVGGINIGDMIEDLELAEGVNVYKNNDFVTSGKLGTGMTIRHETDVSELTVVIKGDLNGDGSLSIEDAQIFLEHLVGNNPLTGAYAEAAKSSVNESDSALKSLRKFLNAVMNVQEESDG